ncbi:MAG: EAL domain-containing protein [gamma proteobacterium symbiont of Lucinoma myriamae]|nr:EAL domain-containing protein [gamma proteobacterium symbiont of Lucinoma myriamae]MCU7818022.1 EAL domain-containing protein [gamma proteobacterium symbiont of Lucinoma myriamae]
MGSFDVYVKSINEIGHFLGMKTVAEYVENDEIIAILKDIGVDYAQGFGIEKPLLISEYMEKSTFLAKTV